MGVLTSETCWAVNWHNKISDIKLVYLYSSIMPPLSACRSKYQRGLTSHMMFRASQAIWKIPDWVLVQNLLHKNFIGADKISEILNDLDPDGGSFSEVSDRDTWEVNSPFSSSSSSSSSSSEEKEVLQSEPDRGRKRTCRVLPKRANTDFVLGWKEQTQMVQKPAFSRVPEINTNFHITQDSSPWDISEIVFSPEMFILIQREINQYAAQHINKKPSNGRTSVISFS